jgi:NTP pyrophosphatase (non-canonical NTP hydrolase)
MIKTSNLDRFVETIARLRAPDGCPWDREQTHKTLARYLLEEAYEVLEAIQSEDADKLKEELGDLLLQIVLNAQVAKDDGKFDMEEVAGLINEKMITRHQKQWWTSGKPSRLKKRRREKREARLKAFWKVFPKPCRPFCKPSKYRKRLSIKALNGKEKAMSGINWTLKSAN